MNSKTFQNHYLVHERDSDILNTQYVIVSSRIRKRQNFKNILWAYNALYPQANVMIKSTEEDKKEAYMNFLKENNMGFLASLVLLSIDKGFTIVLICTQNEWKLSHLQYIKEFIETEFKYPVYDYKKCILGKEKYVGVNKQKTRKFIKNRIKKYKKEQLEDSIEFSDNKEKSSKYFKEMTKTEKKKFLISHELYYNGMTQNEMNEMFDTFFT
jgi:hypothetical protein